MKIMTPQQIDHILSSICEDNDGNVKIEIMHGHNSYTVIDADLSAWELEPEGILRCETSSGTRWIDCQSIHCIGI